MGRFLSPKKLKTVLMLSMLLNLLATYFIVNRFGFHKKMVDRVYNYINAGGENFDNSELLLISKDRVLSNGDDVVTNHQSATIKQKLCPRVPSTLVGHVTPHTSQPASMEEVEKALEAENGTWNSNWHEEGLPLWRPMNCEARHTVAIIIPIRNRTGHLLTFLRHIHPFLQRQQISYGIFVIEQSDKGKFNRAKLLNVGFVEAKLTSKHFDCVFFHDVDHLPEDDRNLYICPSSHQEAQALQLAIAVDIYNYSPSYANYFGAVSGMSWSTFERVNGFSNMYWGWGGEDDDMYRRLTSAGIPVSRTPATVGRYTTLAHDLQTRNIARWEILDAALRRMEFDGLNSTHYKRLKLKQTNLMTHILVDIVSVN